VQKISEVHLGSDYARGSLRNSSFVRILGTPIPSTAARHINVELECLVHVNQISDVSFKCIPPAITASFRKALWCRIVMRLNS